MTDLLVKGLVGFVALFLLFALVLGPSRAADLFGGLVASLVKGIARGLGSLGIYLFGRARSAANSRTTRSVGPGARNRPLTPDGDVYDYRGLATEAESRFLRDGALPVGRYAFPDGKVGAALGVGPEAMARGCLVVGPTGSGKTQNVILPWIVALLESGASVVTVDVKGDIVKRLPKSNFRVWNWNVGDKQSLSWNPLRKVVDDRDVEAVVRSILGTAKPNDPQPFFYERDYRWLRALVGVAKAKEGDSATPASLSRYLGDLNGLRDLLHREARARLYADDLGDLLQMSTDEAARAVSGLLNALHSFRSSEVRRITEASDFDPEDLGSEPTLLVIGAPLSDGRRSEVLSAVLLSRCLNTVYRRLETGEGSSRQPIYFVIDEAARLRERIPYDEALSVVRSAGSGFCLAVQDLVQFGNEDERTAILANCNTLLLMRGCSPQTADAFGARLGNRQSALVSRTQNRQAGHLNPSHHNQTVSNSSVKVLETREIMNPPPSLGRFCGFLHIRDTCANPILVRFEER